MIKKELQDVMRQKRELGLFAESAGFSGFSGAKPELLVVFIHMPTKDRRWPAVLDEVLGPEMDICPGIPGSVEMHESGHAIGTDAFMHVRPALGQSGNPRLVRLLACRQPLKTAWQAPTHQEWFS